MFGRCPVFELLGTGKPPRDRRREGGSDRSMPPPLRAARARHRRPGLIPALATAAVAIAVAACASRSSHESPPQVPGGDPRRGAQAIERIGCGSCHVIPGIRGANGTVGPPLNDFSDRGYIAGELPNNGDNLIRWIMHPRDVEPGTDMPDLSIGEAEARDIAAYLFTLGR